MPMLGKFTCTAFTFSTFQYLHNPPHHIQPPHLVPTTSHPHTTTMSALQPPRLNTNPDDISSASDTETDHFSSASEGDTPNHPPHSPIPITRIERVDDKPAHGEVPGTPAYALRTKDAVPDEIEVVPDGQRSRSGTTSRSRAGSVMGEREMSRPATPGGTAIPKTVVERVDDKPAHGEVEGTLAKEMRGADAEPDEVIKAPEEARSGVLPAVGQGR